MACPVRKYPLKQPDQWKPPVPRWQLVLPNHVTSIQTLYIGAQCHNSSDNPKFSEAISGIEEWLSSLEYINQRIVPAVVDEFVVEKGHDLPYTRVWVCYWTDHYSFHRAISHLNLLDLHSSLGGVNSSIGLWTEQFITPVPRLETNYAMLHEFPGLARIPNTTREEHTLSAYWGAARDRIPDSADDLFEMPGTTAQAPPDDKTHPYETLATQTSEPALQPPHPPPKGIGQHLIGTNYDNVVHIRSGQCWNHCEKPEAEAYETNLQVSLMQGMQYLWDNPVDTGTLGLRWLRNVASSSSPSAPSTTNSPLTAFPADATKKPINETSGAGFFRNLRDLEFWSSSHPTHKKIFAGAHAHARKWGDDRKFMTWHEVSVLKKGEVRWEYVNCDPRTGVVRFVKMDKVRELE